ncbi:hypothetical protein Leryth_027503 [Lithospermum erythrorhizon]|nr:hypothetical protein Leryth_027503 [Lithospermum erythrorhizon]
MMKRKSNAKWGNLIGYSLMPVTIALKNDPLSYIREAQAIIKRKKLSLESRFSYAIIKLGCKFLGVKATSWLTYKLLFNTTILFSNVVGPREEVSFFDHPLTFLAPSVHGLPFALIIHYQSYMNKMTIVFTYDPFIIPNPTELFDDIENSLEDIKNDVIRRVI